MVFFQGRELWHCSLAIWDRITGRPKPALDWNVGEQATAQTIAAAWLDGVGETGRDHVETGDISRNLRRPLTDAEIAQLPLGRRRIDRP